MSQDPSLGLRGGRLDDAGCLETTVSVLPPDGKYHIDLNPGPNDLQRTVRGRYVGQIPWPTSDETLDFARLGKLHLEATVVALSQWNEAVQKLKTGQVAG
ncbi:uncharacterized protein PV06_05639 [Exophiala oligosperma]|uniref:Uncharacterized protein n=1 Tax=Exophiala oligosperma TaxID=215243 RepID=A0A0D2DGE1_9EURO|nr:uncharacterized protein PV06_05639 [Exophiala oligosperma]KIW42053.1 hypothetical protein PV06_05639 [Exophiala oligosperma]